MNSQGVVLILTNSEDSTSDYIETCLKNAGISFIRYNTDSDLIRTHFTYSPPLPIMRISGQQLRPDDLIAIIFRRPKPFEPSIIGDKFQIEHAANEWAETWEGFLAHVPPDKWINHPGCNFKASHKIEQLSRANQVGLQVPQTLVTNDPVDALKFIHSHLNGIIVKPLASGYIERQNQNDDTLIYTSLLSQSNLNFIEDIKSCPVLFQERIVKNLDIRLIALDGKIEAAGLKALDSDGKQRLDIRRNNMFDVEYVPIEIPEDIYKRINMLLRTYDLRFAAIDMALQMDGSWIFFEINPNGQWAWLDLQAGFRFGDFFVNALKV